MKNHSFVRIAWLFLSVVCFCIAGCGGEKFGLVDVSGSVTLDGTPLVGAQVVFFPKAPEEGSAVVGPYSEGTTDELGHFTLASRYGEPGAVPGVHVVSFSWADVDEDLMDLAMEAADEARSLAKEEGRAVTAEEQKEIQAGLAKAKAMLKGRREIPEKYSRYSKVEITVPVDGMNNANFDLTSE